MVVRSKPKNW